MTKSEFVQLKQHARIKYIGKRPLTDIFGTEHTEGQRDGWSTSKIRKCEAKGGTLKCKEYCRTTKMPKSFLKKGVIVQSAYGSPGEACQLNYYGGYLREVIPAEWELVDERKWVEGETDYKRVKSYIPLVARRFKEETKNFLERYKSSMEYKLDSLPLDKKLKAIMELSPEDKKWFGIMSADPETVIALIEKAFENQEL